MYKRLEILSRNSTVGLALSLFIGAPLLFWNAFRYSAPLGYAGMFSLMAELIVKAGFRLPMEVPYYGPGGLPFAYPPLGLYLLATLMRITGRTFILLRFLPPLFSLFSLIPLYFLVLEISRSKPAAMVVVLIASASVELYIPHAWAAGIVRAPAFGFSLTSLLFFMRATRQYAWREILLGGISLGLAGLAHLSYALFAVFWIFFWVLTYPRLANWRIALGITLSGGLVTLPWIALMLFRYGFHVFAGALNSHGNIAFLSAITSPAGVFSRFYEGLQPIFKDALLATLIGTGSMAQIARKHPTLPLMFLLSIFAFQDDGERFVFTIGFILASMSIAEIANFLRNLPRRWRYPSVFGAIVLVLLIITHFWLGGLKRIETFSPRLTSAALDAGDFFQQHTPQNATYLALVPQDEAEWMPYLFRREPLVAQWGSEWLGKYNEQVLLMLAARACQNMQDLECLKGFFVQVQREPDYLIVLKKDTRLNRSLSSDAGWKPVYENSRYTIWSNSR
ncbi:MAG: hypothetical protein ACP5QU_09400 [Anaerolineae bacterium]